MFFFKNKNSKIIIIIVFLNFLAKNLFAFGGSMGGGMGGGAMGGGAMGGGGMGSSGNSGPKSGISIVTPDGSSLECSPFVDKKWESSEFSDYWNGLYFSLGFEYSKFSGDYRITDSTPSQPFDSSSMVPDFDSEKRNFKFRGQNTSPFITIGGGMLIDRLYLATDLEIRLSTMSSSIDVIMTETYQDSNKNKTNVKSKIEYDLKNYLIYNAKIGYLINDRSLVYFNAGLGSFSAYDISMKDYGIITNDTSSSPPIRLSIGAEYALSNHFRVYSDFSHWIIPEIDGFFRISKLGASEGRSRTDVSFNSNLNINSMKFGILYRF